ncbi:putative dna repair protein rad26 [Diaporthe ampelina]|uniref:Putative dna repair protein rad26 n=1 Tax=Diaporthe ampelina TaxID=1214573 RepID=A0A0G2FZK8_9PEZI|nr:putative dna repair protein rad26 [Diaporthe ampelina]
MELSDDDATASTAGNSRSVSPSIGKRKFEDPGDIFADDPDDFYEKFMQSKKRKRATGRVAKAKKGASATPSKGKGKRESLSNRLQGDDDDEFLDGDKLVHALVPEHVRERRRLFDENRDELSEAGLKLPPSYADIDFSDDERDPEELERRPKFDDIEPCRPCEDIPLDLSGGVIPASIAQYLRDYQVEGVQFLHRHFVFQTGCVLGDDMGLGKTVQVAAFLVSAFGKTGDERDAKRLRKMSRHGRGRWYPRVLIICPGSLIENWKNELNRWGWWKTALYHGSGKEDALKSAGNSTLEVMITTYETYRHDEQKLNLIQWDAVIADECHKIKDSRSQITIAMDQVNALCRVGLTGTAIQNKYEELWTLLNWTNPAHFGSKFEWDHRITKPLTVGQSHDATFQQLSRARRVANDLVQKILPDFFLRRMKTLIAQQLPKKSDRVVFCPLTDYQSLAYGSYLESDEVRMIRDSAEPCECGTVGVNGKPKRQGWCCKERLPDGRRWQALVFPAIMTMQKISNHLTLLLPKDEEPQDKKKAALDRLSKCVPDWKTLYKNRNSLQLLADSKYCGKWRILKKLLSFWYENSDKVLIFSHSVRLLRILHHLFTSTTTYTMSFLDGSLSYSDRQKEVDNFNSDPDRFVFLISTKAGGVGLNITSANKVVVFDPHWNPSYDLQAQDRAYRIGQVRDVEVFRLVSAGTIEEIVYARQIYKQQQANIGYNASSERRYFKGVQQDPERKGELFGLQNLFKFQADKVVLKDIVNATNIAEARAGVHLFDVDMTKVEEDNELSQIKKETTGDDDEDNGISQLAALVKSEHPDDLVKKADEPKKDAIQAILASAGVEYTHENSEVIGSSKVEAQLSRRAKLAEEMDIDDPEAHSLLLADTLVNQAFEDGPGYTYMFNPPEDVMRRQFCTMAQHFGYAGATEFAVVVQGWTQEQRRDCLDTFYRKRMEKVLGEFKQEPAEGETKLKPEPGLTEDTEMALRTASGRVGKKEEHADEKVKIGEDDLVTIGRSRTKVKAEAKQEFAIKKDEAATAKKMISSIFIYDDDSDVL